ncbi:MAG: ribonuclease J [Rickettsiaceae bacterium]|nr:ribonuclease J [Rickettsiaceae bacterium]MDP4832509.1 ribonuclease J [Rickettsiaceae bacterium]MDP5020725.1 ribonuclease J [Rickettsiaceae bacterium]MDP5083741.1 ribonuclease J [Rickettsiaceae bacterium]
MSFNLKAYKDKLLFVPLGGSNEIGINVNLYHLQGKWIMVDCGSGFADDHLPGVDMVVADVSFIEEHKKDLLGIVLTHAHEDHLGAIQYLWNELECPIYTTKFTKAFLKSKLSEYSFSKDMKINAVDPKDKLELGPFSIEMIGLTHSAPEMQALMIRTSEGNVLHTGDWKFDPRPIVGEASDQKALKACGDEGVLALVCDSTNVFNPGVSGSEGDVRESLVKIIAECPKMVVVTTFASNLARLDTIIHAGQKAGRKVALTGRSLHRMFAAAQESGYLNDIIPLIDERSVGNYKREELLIIATGCQGESMAATGKMANGSHHSIKLAAKDTVIFSSKIIPGNDKKIFSLFNVFVKKGVEVITERDHFVHVSGHPAVEELKEMYKLIRPNVCIPVHGEPVHIHEHAKLARANGIKHAVEVENGSVVLLEKDGSKVIDTVKNGYLAVDGNYLLPEDSVIFKMRRRMREDGIVVASIVLDSKLKLATPPMLSMPGLLDHIEDGELILSIKEEVINVLQDQRKASKGILINDQIEACVRRALRRIIKSETNKTPVIIVNIEEID